MLIFGGSPIFRGGVTKNNIYWELIKRGLGNLQKVWQNIRKRVLLRGEEG